MTKWCSKCEWSGNKPSANFCNLCGTALVEQELKRCKCGRYTIVPSNAEYCDRCGVSLVDLGLVEE